MIDILSHFHFLKKIVRILENQYLFWGFFVWFFCFGGGGGWFVFKTGFFCAALAVLELTL
jgi:hypothetical protein